MSDPYDLNRFVSAQQAVFAGALEELRRGRKVGHWMWFIFPQLKGLGSSAMAEKFGIASREEAKAYLEHEVLGPRLLECTRVVILVEGRSIDEIFGYPDDLKFRSSMTLFALAAADNEVFEAAIGKYFNGEMDPVTRARL